MSFSSTTGYLPVSIDTIMDSVRTNLNTQFGLSYTAETFVGTNWYKFFYAIAQRLQENEVKTGEIFVKLQDYFATTNELISRPVVTNPGLIEAIEAYGYDASIKKPIDADAGKIYIAIDVDETLPTYASTIKPALGAIIKNSSVAGAVTQGTESTTLVLTNGQSFDFKYKLPNRITTHLRLTITTSVNNQYVIADPDTTKQLLLTNIAERYRLGLDFEPQKYFNVTDDAPWAQSVLLEYSTNGGSSWASTVRTAAYDDLLVVSLANLTLIEA